MAWLRDHADPLAVVCAEDARTASWIPAVTRRALVVAGRPVPVPVGCGAPSTPRGCTLAYGPTPSPEAGPVVFQSGAVTIVEIPKPLR